MGGWVGGWVGSFWVGWRGGGGGVAIVFVFLFFGGGGGRDCVCFCFDFAFCFLEPGGGFLGVLQQVCLEWVFTARNEIASV